MSHISLNGKILPADQPVLLADNKGYRYGDGLFETLKVYHRQILLAQLHFDRLFSSLTLLGYEVPPLFTRERLAGEILQLCERNKCAELGRVRLSVFRGHGGVYEGSNEPHYLVEAWTISPSVNQLNQNGLVIGVFPEARKSCDILSSIKSANYLPYALAARYARLYQWNDCLLLNTHGRIADASIANVFIIKNGRVLTPPLGEGGIDGVMRRHLLSSLENAGEQPLAIDDIIEADELFLTNAISGIRWVKDFQGRNFTCEQTVRIYDEHIKTIFS